MNAEKQPSAVARGAENFEGETQRALFETAEGQCQISGAIAAKS